MTYDRVSEEKPYGKGISPAAEALVHFLMKSGKTNGFGRKCLAIQSEKCAE